MVDAPRTEKPPRVDAPKTGAGAAKPIRDLLQGALGIALKNYLPTGAKSDAIADLVSKILDRSVDSFSGSETASAALQFTKSLLSKAVETIAGKPPTATDAKRENQVRYMSKLTKPVVEAGEGQWKLRIADHFTGEMLKRFGIGATFGEGIKSSILAAVGDTACEDLGRPKGWLALAKHIVGGILRDNNKEGLAKLVEAIPTSGIGSSARASEAAPVTAATDTDKTDKTEAPKNGAAAAAQTADNGAAANTRRASAGSNAVAMQLAQLAFGTKTKDQVTKVQDLVKLVVADRQPPPSEDQVKAVARDLAKVLGSIGLEPGLDPTVAAATIFGALENKGIGDKWHPKQVAELKSRKTKLDTRKAELEKDGGPKDEAGKTALAAVVKELGSVDQSLAQAARDEADANAAAGRTNNYKTLAALFRNMSRAFTAEGMTFEKLQERSPGIANQLKASLGYAVTTFVDEGLGKNVSTTNLNAEVRKFENIYIAITEKDALTTRARKEAMHQKAPPGKPLFYAPLLADIDKNDLHGSAVRIANEVMSQIPDKSKLDQVTAAIEGAIKGCDNNIDVATAAAAAARGVLGVEDPQLTAFIANVGAALAAVPGEISKYEKLIKNIDEGDPENKRGIKQLNAMITQQATEIGKLRKNPKSAENDKAIKDGQERLQSLTSEKSKLEEQKADYKGALDDMRGQQKNFEKQSEALAQRALAFLAYSVVEPETVKKALSARDQGPDGAQPQGPDRPGGGGGGGGDRGGADGVGGPGMSGTLGKSEKAQGLIRERVRQCSMILADPTLSTQDKVLLFILVYASYKKAEQEDSLEELTKMDEKRAAWNSKKEGLAKSSKEKDGLADGISAKLHTAEARLSELQKNPANAGEIEAASKDVQQLRNALATAQDESKRATQAIQEHEQAPEARDDRDVRVMLLERDMQEYDHLLQTANGLLEKYDRLIQQIVRSIAG